MTLPPKIHAQAQSPPRHKKRAPDPAEVVHRLVRIESRLVQLMKHQGMTTDGRSPIVSETTDSPESK